MDNQQQQDEAEMYYRTLTVLRTAAPLVDAKDLQAACFLTGINYNAVTQKENRHEMAR